MPRCVMSSMDAIRYARAGAQVEEIEACYRARFGDFARLAGWIIGDQGRGYDVVQEAFATAIRKRRSFKGTGRLDAWICRIVVNVVSHQLQKRNRRNLHR